MGGRKKKKIEIYFEKKEEEKKKETKKEIEEKKGFASARVAMVNGRVQVIKGSTDIDVGKSDAKNPKMSSTETENRRGKKQKQRSEKWSKDETEKFYKALQIFGTDFSMIEKLLPNRSRRQIKVLLYMHMEYRANSTRKKETTLKKSIVYSNRKIPTLSKTSKKPMAL